MATLPLVILIWAIPALQSTTSLSDPEVSEKCGVMVGAAMDLVGSEYGFDLRRRAMPHPPRCLIVEMRIMKFDLEKRADDVEQ